MYNLLRRLRPPDWKRQTTYNDDVMLENSEHPKYGTHDRGGGKLFDFSEATDDCFIDAESELHDYAEIYNSTLIRTTVRGNAIIANARLVDCYVEADARITGGQAFGCQFYDFAAMAEDAEARSSCFHGRSRLFGKAHVENVASREASIYGDAVLTGAPGGLLALDGLYRIGTGTWREAPRFVRFHELQISLTESTDGHAYVACKRMKMTDWIKRGERLGKHFGWPPEFVEEGRKIFREWMEAISA